VIKYASVFTAFEPGLDPAAPQWYYALCQADFTNMGNGSFLAADIGLFRVWNSALSAAQIQELYNENVSRFSI
jgi:hypothetical protein